MSVLLETSVGDIVVDLLVDERPRSCLNFLKLCKVKFYNFVLFHYVKRNYIAQTGDPTSTGTGGESIFRQLYGEQARFFDAETAPRIKHTQIGTISMVNNGNNMHGSQFFITLGENLDYLDNHTVFGHVVEGEDTLQKINEAICDDRCQPFRDIRINHTIILDDPFDDPSGLQVPDKSPEPTKEILESGRIGADEQVDDTEGKTMEEVDEMLRERKAKAETHILEMIGDIPDAEIKPPENVLFVCKLNPITSSEDLEIIFSRFGVIKSCEVIRDQKTGDSLCYAFIEYDNVEECERAYFKMDNVLIDDRRIHVDFSQSVAKMKWDYFRNKYKAEASSKQDSQATVRLKDKYAEKDKYDFVYDEDENTTEKERKGSSKEDSYRKKNKHRDVSPKRHSSDRPESRHESSRSDRHQHHEKEHHYYHASYRGEKRSSHKGGDRENRYDRSDDRKRDHGSHRDKYYDRRRSPRR